MEDVEGAGGQNATHSLLLSSSFFISQNLIFTLHSLHTLHTLLFYYYFKKLIIIIIIRETESGKQTLI